MGGVRKRKQTLTESSFTHGSLGFRLLKKAQDGGFVLSEIVDGGQAAGFGYSVGDSLVAINGTAFLDQGIMNVEDVIKMLKETSRPVSLKIIANSAPVAQGEYAKRISVLEC